MKKVLLVAALLVLAGGPAWAGSFVNGGFETGSFANWTLNGGEYCCYPNGVYNWYGDPGKSAVVGVGTDPFTGGALNRVYQGDYSARVNNYDSNYHFSTISQTVANYTDPNMFFAWAAVIEDPGHAQPGHVRVTLHNDTENYNLYDTYIDYYNHPGGVTWSTYGGWGYTNWNVFQAVLGANDIGDTFTLTVLASDCSWGGHGGYAYVDGFGAVNPVVPEPASMILLGSGLVGLAARLRRRK